MLLWEVCKAKGRGKEVDTDRPELKSINLFSHSSIHAFIYLISVIFRHQGNRVQSKAEQNPMLKYFIVLQELSAQTGWATSMGRRQKS